MLVLLTSSQPELYILKTASLGRLSCVRLDVCVCSLRVSVWPLFLCLDPRILFTTDVESIGWILLRWYYFCFCAKTKPQKEIVGEIRPFVFKVHTQSLILTSTHTDLHKPINTHTNAHTAQWFREHIVLSIKSRLETFLGLRHENYSRSSCYVHVVYFCVCVCYIKSWHRLSVSRDEQSVCIWHWQLFLTVDIPPTVRHLFL